MAVLTKIHHAVIDGLSGAEIMALLLDLTPEGREEAYRLSVQLRALEAALDPQGRSSTVRAVLARLGQTA